MQRGEAARPKTPLRLYLSLAHICPFVSTTTLRPLHVTCLIILVSRNYTGHGVTGSKTHRLKICQCYSSMKNGLKINSRASSGQVTLESDSNNVLGYHSSKFTPCFSNTWLFFCCFFFNWPNGLRQPSHLSVRYLIQFKVCCSRLKIFDATTYIRTLACCHYLRCRGLNAGKSEYVQYVQMSCRVSCRLYGRRCKYQVTNPKLYLKPVIRRHN